MTKQSESGIQKMVLDYLQKNCIGRPQAITGSELQIVLGIRDGREMREAIHELRKAGNDILSSVTSPYGYFIPAEPGEVQEVMRHFASRIIREREACLGIRKGLEKRFGTQIELPFS